MIIILALLTISFHSSHCFLTTDHSIVADTRIFSSCIQKLEFAERINILVNQIRSQ